MSKIFDLIGKEQKRQEEEICLIASENYMSENVMKACGNVLLNKYSEGLPNKRYYGGCEVVDEIEQYAIDKCKELFNCRYANVQPHSGCQANQAVYLALLKPGDTILAMNINDGAHISHSLPIGMAGTFYNVVTYGLDEDELINYEEIKQKLYEYRPKLLIVGCSAYSRIIDFERIRKIIDDYNYFRCTDIYALEKFSDLDLSKEYEARKCYFMVDMAHIAGLVATDLHPSPVPYADVVTSTVQKTLRSGRGGIVLTNDEDIAKKIDKAVFPRLQGGPLNNMIAGKAVGFEEALTPEFKKYQEQVLKNIKAMEEVFNERGIKLVSKGTDNHLLLLDLKDKSISGKQLEDALSEVGIVVNKNAVKDDPRPKSETSGIRLGTPAITTRGAIETDCVWIANQICNIIDILTGEYDYEGIDLVKSVYEENVGHELTPKEVALMNIKEGVENFCLHHPIYK